MSDEPGFTNGYPDPDAPAEEREPRQFIATGRITLDGVTFFITAADADEARAKAQAGDYDDYDIAGASTCSSDIDGSVELNE